MESIQDKIEKAKFLAQEQCFDILDGISQDELLSDNFETALSALIEHHGADALTALAAVMRNLDITIEHWHVCGYSSIMISRGNSEIYSDSVDLSKKITANDIKPEK